MPRPIARAALHVRMSRIARVATLREHGTFELVKSRKEMKRIFESLGER
jgi:hypothetical protein